MFLQVYCDICVAETTTTIYLGSHTTNTAMCTHATNAGVPEPHTNTHAATNTHATNTGVPEPRVQPYRMLMYADVC